jgi:hypothetical protein
MVFDIILLSKAAERLNGFVRPVTDTGGKINDPSTNARNDGFDNTRSSNLIKLIFLSNAAISEPLIDTVEVVSVESLSETGF